MVMKIRSLASMLLLIMLILEVASGQEIQGMAIIANKPSALGVGGTGIGHLAFAFQDPLDGLFVFGSVGLDFTYSGVLIDPANVDINKRYTFDELKKNLAENKYESYKVFYVNNPQVDAAINAENELTTTNYNIAASITKPITDPFSHAVNADDENCLTASKKVLEAYGVKDLTDPNLLTVTPNAYYLLNIPGDAYYPDNMGDDPVVPNQQSITPSINLPVKKSRFTAGPSFDLNGFPIMDLAVVPSTQRVTLTLYVRDGSANGPIISGAQVFGQDASGNSFQETTDSNGYVTIEGEPGTWTFSVSADGYKVETWDQNIAEDCTKHAFLQPVGHTVVQESESSVVGKWQVHQTWWISDVTDDVLGPNGDNEIIEIFYSDGTFTSQVVEVNPRTVMEEFPEWNEVTKGKWTQYGNTVQEISEDVFFEWIKNGDTMYSEIDRVDGMSRSYSQLSAVRIDAVGSG